MRFIMLCVLAVGCSLGGPGEDVLATRILFIGNSLTYTNDMPGIVEALADSAGGMRIQSQRVVQPDYALVDHWNEEFAHEAIAAGNWSMVVLQQGPSSLQVNRDSLRLLTSMFADEIEAVGARTALYSVWPMQSRMQDFERAIESYELAANDVNGVMIPVASAWLAAWQRDPDLELYDSDGLHPSELGSYLAALVMYATVLDAPPTGLARRLVTRGGVFIDISAADAAILQAAAAAVTGW